VPVLAAQHAFHVGGVAPVEGAEAGRVFEEVVVVGGEQAGGRPQTPPNAYEG